MMKNHRISTVFFVGRMAILAGFMPLLLASCREHFITDTAVRKEVGSDFRKTEQLLSQQGGDIFSVFSEDITRKEKEALQFLYAYMPLSDLADYPGGFLLMNIRSSLEAQSHFAWGKDIPEDIFRHFVLPIRVNNENLDSSRVVFFRELKDRLKGMSMREAALEVNHWCHEKVTYKGTDGRTSSPLNTVKCAFGRCGEESVLTVAALRSVSIPARQCYTPRWAHCDDNHAWVEVWVEGKWYFIGACEPEPDLNMGWFAGPATRAMMVNTTVFGKYKGPEEVLEKTGKYTKINLLTNYADTHQTVVQVQDPEGKAVPNIMVEFQLYNYAEFFPIGKGKTDQNGCISIITGYGDLLAWASDKVHLGYARIPAGTDTTEIILMPKSSLPASSSDMFTPPKEKHQSLPSDEKARERNNIRLHEEDSIRMAYEATFIDSAKVVRLSETLKLPFDSCWRLLHQSRGNWREILDFMASVPPEKHYLTFGMPGAISQKDLRDASAAVLMAHIDETVKRAPSMPTDIYLQHLLSPRISNEWMTPYKAILWHQFSERNFSAVTLRDWILDSLTIDDTANYYRVPISPAGVLKIRICDRHSRDIFFVASCRSLGIPARIETATGKVQYYQDGTWDDVFFEQPQNPSLPKGILNLHNDPLNKVKPAYYVHLTIQRLTDGFYRSLDYETDHRFNTYPCTLELDTGSYRIITGNRMQDGSVLVNMEYFTLSPNQRIVKTLTLLKEPPAVQIDIKMSQLLDQFIETIDKQKLELKSLVGNEELLLIWMEPDREPTKHLINELLMIRKDLDKWTGSMVIIGKEKKDAGLIRGKHGKGLPSNILYTSENHLLNALVTEKLFAKSAFRYPLIIIINKTGEILYLSDGYKIGSGEAIKKCLIK
ncbi:MAG: transglutaminase domain-containing protein [Bacteroidetes bacterium]|nr:transglutaminase domain-containing protein [Bacteroidota bacterium]